MLNEIKKLGPGAFNHHLISRAHRKASGRKMMVLSLVLTPMVDMFSLLVIFLLQAFSASPELIVVQKGLSLPNAVTGREIRDAPILAVSADGVFLDQIPFGKPEKVIQNPQPLMEKLEKLRTVWIKTHPQQKFPGEITFQADKEISSVTVAQLMGVLPSQSYGVIQLAVMAGKTN